jgi:hypothetical protein
LLAQFDRIYYFDIPLQYAQLASEHPDLIVIRHFGDFFAERLAEEGGHSSND